MMNKLDVYDIGAKVKIGESINAVIESICIRDNYSVEYGVSWWDGRQRRIDQLPADQVVMIDPCDLRKVRIGFLKQESK